jgi:type III secretory pathway component EscU
MAKIQIKSEKLTPFGGIFSIMEQFDSTLSSVIDSTLGLRCSSFGYQYSEIVRSLMSIYFCGGSCIEDVTTHLIYSFILFCRVIVFFVIKVDWK